jgi:hypothetical protein
MRDRQHQLAADFPSAAAALCLQPLSWLALVALSVAIAERVMDSNATGWHAQAKMAVILTTSKTVSRLSVLVTV